MCTNGEIFQAWLSAPEDRLSSVSALLDSKFNLQETDDLDDKYLQDHIQTQCSNIKRRWQNCGKREDRFLAKHKDWIDSKHILPEKVRSVKRSSTTPNLNTLGRPQKPFAECSEKTKKRKVEDLIKTRSLEELSLAAELSASNSSSPASSFDDSTALSTEEALSLYLDLDLTERKYEVLKKTVNAVHKNFFPSIYALRQAKKRIIPENKVTETSAEIDFQDALNKTVQSISQLVKIEKNTKAKLVCKTGFDGSGGHSIYKQKFENTESTDEYMFLSAFVPLRLTDLDSGELLWNNDRPGSTLYCRPIKFLFQKESPDLVKQEESDILVKIDNLVECTVPVGDYSLQASFEFHFTMVDGSVCNTLSDTNSTATCYICGALPSEMNTPKSSHKVPNKKNYRFGLSTLHLWIRSFECLLHIAYRLSFKRWRAMGKENKDLLAQEKKRIQSEFKLKMGLIVDQPKQGFGSSNDGNTARRFFSDPKLSSEITKIEQALIEKLSLILRIIASGSEIEVELFQSLLCETKDLYLKHYSWFYMPCTLHKLLFHGVEVMQYFDLPIGQLTEEALEASHKVFRRTRLHHARKTSRVFNCQDVINHMLLMSDPLISSKRKVLKKQRDIDPDIAKYLVCYKEPE